MFGKTTLKEAQVKIEEARRKDPEAVSSLEQSMRRIASLLQEILEMDGSLEQASKSIKYKRKKT